jgi:gamma-glutamylcysteine synthetase
MILPSSAAGSPRAEAPALVGTEIELPVVTREGHAPPPSLFQDVWSALAARGWTRSEFGVSRPHPSAATAISSARLMSTDTGPIFELATPPSPSLDELAAHVTSLRAEAAEVLDAHGCRLLASGVHPALPPTRDNYYRFRTPRPAYDYAIRERGWHHWSIVDKAAVQEIVDVPFADAPRAAAVLHRLAGLMNFVLRNDPGLHARNDRRLSVRPLAWRSHVAREGRFAGDAHRVLVPAREIEGWRDYLELLWTSSPMFLAGTKDHGQAWLTGHPTFLEFLRGHARAWDARLLDGSPLRVVPEPAHVAVTDWSYMGFARIRWRWRPNPPSPAEIVAAWDEGQIEALLERSLEKVVVENRCNSTQPEGDEMVSVALVAGLLANLNETSAFAGTAPYAFWLRLLDESTRRPLRSTVLGRDVPSLVTQMIDIARRGLRMRGEADVDRWLDPLAQRVADGASPSERRLAAARVS